GPLSPSSLTDMPYLRHGSLSPSLLTDMPYLRTGSLSPSSLYRYAVPPARSLSPSLLYRHAVPLARFTSFVNPVRDLLSVRTTIITYVSSRRDGMLHISVSQWYFVPPARSFNHQVHFLSVFYA